MRLLPLSIACLLPLTIATAAKPPQALRPGLWRIVNMPLGASLDGRKLDDLPYSPPPPEDVCLTPDQATRPLAFFTRESPTGCTFARQSIAGGKVDVAGTCASAPGFAAGSMRLAGRWTPDAYTLRFATITVDDNGRMGFDGTLTGKRIGDCR